MSGTRAQAGLGLLEVMLAAAIGLVLFSSLIFFAQNSRKQSNQIRQSDMCESFAQNVRTVLETSNGNVRIRNWSPRPGERRAPGDTIDQFAFDQEGRLLGDRFFNSQNILNTTNWALALYNNNNPDVCSDQTGVTFRDAALSSFLSNMPTAIDLPKNLEQIRLVIKKRETGLAGLENCTNEDTEAHPKLRNGFSVKLGLQFRDGEKVTNCNVTYEPQFYADQDSPSLWGAFRNGDEVSFSSGKNACQRACAIEGETDSEKLPAHSCDERHDVAMAVETNEAGSLFFCKRVGRAWQTTDQNYRLCQDIAAQISTFDSPMNNKAHVEFKFPHLPDNSEFPYEIQILAVDTGGNVVEDRFEFWVYRPPCL